VESLGIAEVYGRGVLPLRSAIYKISGSTQTKHVLSPIHSDFAYVCLKSKQFDVASKILLQYPIYELDSKNGLTAHDYLTYYYYAGMVFIGCKQFEYALESLQMTLIIESQILSIIQIAAYKKFALVSLLLHGEITEVADRLSNTLPYVVKNCKRLSHPYMELAKAYKKGPESITKVLTDYYDEFGKDQNLGLARQIQKAVVKRNIQRLTSTYITLELDDIAKRAKLKSAAEAENYILAMIESGDIVAKIDQQKGMISFVEQVEEYDTATMSAKLDQKIAEIISLGKEVKQKEKETTSQYSYVAMTMPQDEEGMGGGGGGPRMFPGEGGSREDRDLQRALEMSRHTS